MREKLPLFYHKNYPDCSAPLAPWSRLFTRSENTISLSLLFCPSLSLGLGFSLSLWRARRSDDYLRPVCGRSELVRGCVSPCSVRCAVLSCSSVFWLFATPWTIACQASLSMGILQARILEWIAMPSSRASSQPRDESRSPTLHMDSSPAEPPGKPLSNHHL